MNLITFEGISKTFRQGHTTILKNISFTVEAGEFVVLRGENGAGKKK